MSGRLLKVVLFFACSFAAMSPRADAFALPLATNSNLDLPVSKPSEEWSLNSSKKKDCLDSCKDIQFTANLIDSWGGRFANKKWLEEKLKSGKTIPAPILHWEDFQMHLLIPLQGRLDMRAPMGALLRIKLPSLVQKSTP